jgi:hypothetical protein
MKRQNEANAVEALLDIMPFITGCRYVNLGSPDEENSTLKEVDFVLKAQMDGKPSLAVEHTIVEAFRGQKEYVYRSYEIVQEVDRRCKGQLPANRFFGLVIPPSLVDSLRKKAIEAFMEATVPWIVETARDLPIDEYRTMDYSEQDVLLMCSGSLPEINGTIGRMPGSPMNQKELVDQSLWLSIQHGLGKFPKYKRNDYDTVLLLENISGQIHHSMLLDLENDLQKHAMISALVDYIIVLTSNNDQMIVGNIWKEKQVRYDPVPYNRRFRNEDSKWIPYE